MLGELHVQMRPKWTMSSFSIFSFFFPLFFFQSSLLFLSLLLFSLFASLFLLKFSFSLLAQLFFSSFLFLPFSLLHPTRAQVVFCIHNCALDSCSFTSPADVAPPQAEVTRSNPLGQRFKIFGIGLDSSDPFPCPSMIPCVRGSGRNPGPKPRLLALRQHRVLPLATRVQSLGRPRGEPVRLNSRGCARRL